MNGMTTHDCPGCGSPLHEVIWGPFTLVSPNPIPIDKLDAGDGEAWMDMGLKLDPVALGQDYAHILRHIRAFMAYVDHTSASRSTLQAEVLATRIFQSDRPVILPLWGDVPWA